MQKTHCPQKGISFLPDHHVLSAMRRMNSLPRLTAFHSAFASAYTAHLRYEPRCFVCFVCCVCLGCFVVLGLGLVLGSYLHSIFNSIKVTCASRHTQRLHLCKKIKFFSIEGPAASLIRWWEVDPSWFMQLVTQFEGVSFYIEASPCGLALHFDEPTELRTS